MFYVFVVCVYVLLCSIIESKNDVLLIVYVELMKMFHQLSPFKCNPHHSQMLTLCIYNLVTCQMLMFSNLWL
jgi:hypothetical protein